MKVISTVINPIPDKDGFHIFECDNCYKKFLINLQDNKEDKIYCPYCGNEGNMITFTNNIREKAFKDHPISTINSSTDEKIELDIEQIKELIENLNSSDIDVEVLEYSINEFINTKELVNFEFICCDKTIKIPMDMYKAIKFCAFCKGEILLNIIE